MNIARLILLSKKYRLQKLKSGKNKILRSKTSFSSTLFCLPIRQVTMTIRILLTTEGTRLHGYNYESTRPFHTQFRSI